MRDTAVNFMATSCKQLKVNQSNFKMENEKIDLDSWDLSNSAFELCKYLSSSLNVTNLLTELQKTLRVARYIEVVSRSRNLMTFHFADN